MKKFQSPELCHKFRVLTVFRSSTLVLGLAHPQRLWPQTWLPCIHICTSWGKQELSNRRRIYYNVGLQQPRFAAILIREIEIM